MGACSFYQEAEGASADECFSRLVSEARYESGHDSYNGTISTCSLGAVFKVADVFNEAAKKKGLDFAKNDGFGQKWKATCLDLGRVGYEVITATKKPAEIKKAAKFATQFVVIAWDIYGGQNIAGLYDTKTEADERAMVLALKNPGMEYSVCKRPVNVNGGSDKVSLIQVTRTVKKTKPKTVKKNMTVKEIRHYAFYGFAAE